MKKGTTKTVASFLGALTLTALLMANVFATADGTMSLKTNIAKADAPKCLTETVACVRGDGSTGTRTVCNATASGATCACGTSSPCQ